MEARTQLILLLLCAFTLFLLSFMPSSRAAVTSSETRFSEASMHGLNIIPASCASGANYYHATLPSSADGGGYVLPGSVASYGAYDARVGAYVCVDNTSGNVYFIPGNTAAELNQFKAHPPPGVSAW